MCGGRRVNGYHECTQFPKKGTAEAAVEDEDFVGWMSSIEKLMNLGLLDVTEKSYEDGCQRRVRETVYRDKDVLHERWQALLARNPKFSFETAVFSDATHEGAVTYTITYDERKNRTIKVILARKGTLFQGPDGIGQPQRQQEWRSEGAENAAFNATFREELLGHQREAHDRQTEGGKRYDSEGRLLPRKPEKEKEKPPWAGGAKVPGTELFTAGEFATGRTYLQQGVLDAIKTDGIRSWERHTRPVTTPMGMPNIHQVLGVAWGEYESGWETHPGESTYS